MITILIVAAVQVLYWFLLVIDWMMEFILHIFPLENHFPIYLLRPFSALVAVEPRVYIAFQCVLLVAIFICMLFTLFSTKFTKGVKLCAGINLIGIIFLFFIPFEFSTILNLCISILLLCFVIANYKQNKQIEIYRE